MLSMCIQPKGVNSQSAEHSPRPALLPEYTYGIYVQVLRHSRTSTADKPQIFDPGDDHLQQRRHSPPAKLNSSASVRMHPISWNVH